MEPRATHYKYLNGWHKDDDYNVLVGNGLHCLGCGTCRGIICVTHHPEDVFPEKMPDYPFPEQDCPVCRLWESEGSEPKQKDISQRLAEHKAKKQVDNDLIIAKQKQEIEYLKTKCECLNHARTFEETQGGLYAPSKHAPSCKNYKAEPFARLTLDGSAVTLELKELQQFLMDDDQSNEYALKVVHITHDQFEALEDFAGF